MGTHGSEKLAHCKLRSGKLSKKSQHNQNMNNFTIAFLIVNAAFLLTLPRKWAPLPLLIGTCYMTYGQGFDLGPFSFTVIRILIAIGVLRVILHDVRLTGGMNKLDWLMMGWAGWALISSIFRPDASSVLVFRLGLVFNTCGIYFLLRVFCQSLDDLLGLLRVTAILLIPIAFEMVYEHLLSHNLFSILGGVPSTPISRDGNLRAQGPFLHPILAGTVGAVCLPLMVALWSRYRKTAVIGIFSCLTVVICSSSSGPVLSVLAGVGGLFMWRYRHQMKFVRWAGVIGYIALELVMKAPAYSLIQRIPIVAGSTGWHRVELINSAIRHINEWWLSGTDKTLHWMPTGVDLNPNHTDITNHYLQMGVWGGLPLMVLFILTLVKAFSYVGQFLKTTNDMPLDTIFMVWALGVSVFASVVTMLSVSYFDQSFVFLYLTLAVIGSIQSWTKSFETRKEEAESTVSLRGA